MLKLTVKTNSLLQDYFSLCKPKVILLMLITTWVGMHLATNSIVPLATIFFATIGIALAAASAAIINHLVDRHIDAMMQRTAMRPIANGRVSAISALLFAFSLGFIGLSVLYVYINKLTALLTFGSLIGYAVIYTIFLKHATPQNIVIGGIVGATPPLLGWCAVTNNISAQALLLALIIFIWTPPHFWALAIHRCADYKKANVPMLPATHGIEHTKLNILLYTILLFAVSLLPVAIDMSGTLYLLLSLILNCRYLYLTWLFYKDAAYGPSALALFQFSILYLALIFLFLLIDHYLILYFY